MSVQFILGRSGTGKTSYCINAIVEALVDGEDSQQLLFLVPEQASYQAERAILGDKRIAGYSRLRVVSFDRLQYLVLGRRTARPALSRTGRQMVIQRILRERAGELKVFGPSAHWAGVGREVAETISELHQYSKTPEDVERLVEQLCKEGRKSLAGEKFADIGLVFREYLDFIEGKFIDPDMEMMAACRAVAESEFVRGARLWVDGFSGFTTSELAILTELLKSAAEAQIALCLDGSRFDVANPESGGTDPVSLFGVTERTYVSLVETIKRCKLKLAEPVILEEAVRFSNCSQLGHIERNIFADRDSASAKQKGGGEWGTGKRACEGNVRIVSAANARAEARFAARQIVKLVREGGYRYRDIGVIASDIEGYQDYITAYFEDYGIPFFIDRRRFLNQHAVVGLIYSAFETILNGFSHSDIFSFLKNDLVGPERGEVDLLENYCLAFGVDGGDWGGEKEWSFQGQREERFDEGVINKLRLEAVGPLVELRDKLGCGDDGRGTISAYEFTQIVFDFLDRVGVRERIGGWIQGAVEAGEMFAAEEHRQFYSRLVDVFDELAEVFGSEELTCGDYFSIMESAFSQLTLAFIPPGLDEVLVGSIERSRHPDLKAVFLLGATQRQFPVPVSSRGVLSDSDRTAGVEADFELAGGSGQQLAERQYLAYIAFTRGSEFLCISYPLADEKGAAVVRSQFVGDVQSLFEGLCEESVAAEEIDVGGVYSENELADLLVSGLGRDAREDESGYSSERLEGLLNEVCSDEGLGGVGSNVKRALGYCNAAKLDKRIVGELFGAQIKSSATRLGTFAACPYQYFAKYILGLEERKEFKFEPLDFGVFYHGVLDAFIRRLKSAKIDFATIKDEELLALLREEKRKFVGADSFVSNFAGRSMHNSFIIHSAGEALEDCVKAIGQMVRAGDFQPSVSEISFGEVKGARERLGEYIIDLSDKRRLSLSGKIDRVDITEAGGQKSAIIFDYKRTGKSFSWSKFYHGLDMQLAIYMLAVRKAEGFLGGAEVVGGFYMPVEVRAPRAAFDELTKRAGKFNYKAKGIFNGEFSPHLDGEVRSGWSDFYNFQISKKDRQYGDYGRSGALKPDDFEKVLRFAEGKIVSLGEEIVSGRIDVNPYRLGGSSPCEYCKYRLVCRFDWQINDYKPLHLVGKSDVLEERGAADG